MKKLLITLILCSAVFAHDFYVAPNGSDAADGSIEKPFATVQRARDQIRHLRSITSGDVDATVNIRGGMYQLSETLVFNELDGGRADCPVVYRAYNNEPVHIAGGRVLSAAAFKKVTDESMLSRLDEAAKGNVYVVNLKELGITDFGSFGQYGHTMVIPAPLELFFDGRPMQIARYPNEGYVQIGKIVDEGSVPRRGDYSNRGGVFKYDDPRHERWSGVEDIWLAGTFNNGYSDDNIKIESIDTDAREVKLAMPYLYGLGSGKPYQHYYAYNILCELDRAGEYYLDRSSGDLYFWPPASLDSGNIIVSMFDDPIIAMEGVEYMTLEAITVEVGRGIGVYMERSSNNTIAGCTVRNVGTGGIFMGMGARQTFPMLTHNDYEGVPQSRRVGSYQGHMYLHTGWDRYAGFNNRVVSCDVYNTGSGGIQLGGGSKRDLTPGGSEALNCRVYDFNRRNKFLWAGINVDGVGNRVAHCEIFNSAFQAIYVRGNEHIFEYNYIHKIAKESDDTSAWYLGRNPSDRGNIIRYNFFYDVGRPDRSVMGVYCDDATTDVKVIGNIFYKVAQGRTAVFSNAGQDLLVKNNIFVDCGFAVELSSFFYTWGRYKGPDGKPQQGGVFYEMFKNPGIYPMRLTKHINIYAPPYSEKYPGLTDWLDPLPDEPGGYVGIRPRRNLMENNVVVSCRKELELKGDYAQFETRGNFLTDENPGFENIDKLDMRLKPNSVVYDKIPGFEPIPFEKIGLYEDKHRKLTTDKFANEPSSGKQLQTSVAEHKAAYDPSQDMSFSPQRRAWELVLKNNLGDFYYPLYLKDLAAGKQQAWDYIEDNPALPRVLIIGDSISRGYTVPVRNALEGAANVHRAPANCGPTANGLAKMDIWLGDGKWDLITFNFGIHDRNTATDVYLKNLEQIIAKLKSSGANLVWVSSTPVPSGAAEYVEGAIDRLNAAANELMSKNGIPVIDLHSRIAPLLSEYQLPNNCHYKTEGYDYMGRFVAEEIRKHLEAKE